MEKEFIPYPFALRMKRLRFNEPCISFYSQGGKHNFDIQSPSTNIGSWSDQEHYCSSPLFQQAFRWFESKGYRNYVASNQFGGKVNYWFAITPPEELTYSDVEGRSTKEEAELACLEKLIEIVEQKNKKDETN